MLPAGRGPAQLIAVRNLQHIIRHALGRSEPHDGGLTDGIIEPPLAALPDQITWRSLTSMKQGQGRMPVSSRFQGSGR